MRDRAFDEKLGKGEEALKHLEASHAVRSGNQRRGVNVDLPLSMIESLDKKAKKLGAI